MKFCSPKVQEIKRKFQVEKHDLQNLHPVFQSVSRCDIHSSAVHRQYHEVRRQITAAEERV